MHHIVMSSRLSASTAPRAKWWKIVSDELERPTAKGIEGTSSSGDTSTSESEITVEGRGIVGVQARHMLNTAVDHSVLPSIATLSTAWQALKDLYDLESLKGTNLTNLQQ